MRKEMMLYLVCYELKGHAYVRFHTTLEQMRATHILANVWLVHSGMEAQELLERLYKVAGQEDGLLVTEVTQNSASCNTMQGFLL